VNDVSVVVVGAGHAGFETAMSLRSKGFSGPLTLIGDEPELPYQRPPLSKGVLKGTDAPDSVTMRPHDFFDTRRIDLRVGSAAVGIDRSVRAVELADGSRIGYDHLVLATGARTRPLTVPGAQLPGVMYLRTVRDATALTAVLGSASSVVVIGGGFIGLEVAAAARGRGTRVTIVEAMPRPMTRAVSAIVSNHFVDEHHRHGVTWRFGTGVTEILARDGRAGGVRTDTGETIDADVVVVGIGVIPNTELAQNAGIAVHDGIVVDDHLRTDDPNVSAIGDCASFPAADGGLHRLESVQNATDHARCVAEGLVGNAVRYRATPWFWTEQYAGRLQIAGLSGGHDLTIVRGSPESGSFSVFCFAADELRCVESVNRPRDHFTARKILTAGCGVTPAQAADEHLDLKTLLPAKRVAPADAVLR
jgi:3-phenylpropionate/trans-cinnamate dioxygenase ferredoxin reductase subunit